MVNKLVKDAKVAVIISPGYGAGWSTWNRKNSEELLFDRELAEAILNGENRFEVAERKWPEVYKGGLEEAEVQWVEMGSRFFVEECDGDEVLTIIGPDFGYIA